MRMQLKSVLAITSALAMFGAAPVHAEMLPAAFPPETEAALQAIVDKHQARTGAPGVLVGVWAPGRGEFVRAQAGDRAPAPA